MIIPEYLFQYFFAKGFAAVRSDTRIMDALFKNLPQQNKEQYKNFILKNHIDFCLNYPKSQVKSPSLILLLRSEKEAETFLGDHMGTSPNYGVPDDDLAFSLLGGGVGSVSKMPGLGKELTGKISVTDATSTYVEFDVNSEVSDLLNERLIANFSLVIIEGTGRGQVRDVLEANSNYFTVTTPFTTVPDATSKFVLRSSPPIGNALGEPSRVFKDSARNVVRIGSNYEVQYQLDIVASSQEEVLCLYAVTKAILYAQKQHMEEQGMMAVKISASDLAPRGDYLPDEIYQRSLTITFTYPFKFLQEFEAASTLIFRLIPRDPFTVPTPDQAVVTATLPLE